MVLSEPAARFHWLDSLAGIDWAGGSAGKTVNVHRAEYLRTFGAPSRDDLAHLRRFAEVRVRFTEARYREWAERGDSEFSALLDAFLEAPDETVARERAARLLDERDLAELTAALDHFRPHYRRIWRDGAWADPFLRDARRGRDGRRLSSMLARLARFFGVDTDSGRPPRVVLVPVPAGGGTHAAARDRTILIELRPEDRLAEAASVIAHESAHFLFGRMDDERRKRLEQVFGERGNTGVEAWKTLNEALPTALGQGVFDREFRRDAWSPAHPWYHLEDVDAYAKAIFPFVERAYRRNGTFDDDLARQMSEAFRPNGASTEITPRSP